jgi:quinol-cytochrome oxidoreductase complex cytochrome b subunit
LTPVRSGPIENRPSRQEQFWRIAPRVVLLLLAAAVLVLAVSGVWLWFAYRPTAADAWPTKHPLSTVVTTASVLRRTHRVTSYVTGVLAIATLVLLIGRHIATRGRGIVAGVGVVVTALAASFTGYLLPWDQLALWAVTVGDDMSGIQSTFGGKVKYILLGSKEVSIDTYHFWAIAHVVLGVIVGGAVLLAWLRVRESRSVSPPPPTPAPEAAPEPVG